jgi:hypothetical protein
MPKDTDMELKDKEGPKFMGAMILLRMRWHPQPRHYCADANEHRHGGPDIQKTPGIWTSEGNDAC